MDNKKNNTLEYKLRSANINDIPVLIKHHHFMFKEICLLEDNSGTFYWQEMDKAYQDKLKKNLQDKSCFAFVVEVKNKIIASGAVSIVDLVPIPTDPNYHIGYIHSIYTEKAYRGKGLAKLIMQKLIETCKTQGIRRIQLVTSKVGKKLYEDLGFKINQNAMSLFIAD